MKICPKCGATGGDEVKFCQACGEAMVDAPANEAPAAPVNEAPAAPVNEAPKTPTAPPMVPPTAQTAAKAPTAPPMAPPIAPNASAAAKAPTVPPMAPPTAPAAGQAPKSNANSAVKNITDTPDTTAEYDPEDIKKNTLMAVLSYISVLVFVPMFAAKESKFARYHTNQGLTLFVAEAAYGVVTWLLTTIVRLIVGGWAMWIYNIISTVLTLIAVVFFALALLGIINVANGKAKELPIIGKYRLLK